MKLKEILNESTTETYLVSLKDGAGFNVKADSTGEARKKAKEKLRPGQVIDGIVKDRQGSNQLDDKKKKLNAFVDNSRKFQKQPSAARSFKRKIDRAATAEKLQTVSDAISAFGDKAPEPKKEDKKTDEKE